MLFGPRKEARAALLTSRDHGTVSLNSPLPPLLSTAVHTHTFWRPGHLFVICFFFCLFDLISY